MIQRVASFALAAAIALPAMASAQVYGTFTGASPLPVNGHLAGGYLISSENTLGLMAQLRLSFYPGVDFGFQGGFARQEFGTDDRTTLRLATDLKYEISRPTADSPFSISLGGGLGVETGDDWNILSVGPSIVGSRTFAGNGDLQFTPFVSAGLLFTNVSVGPTDESDISIPFRIGSEIKLNSQLSITGELQLKLSDDFNDDTGFALGVNSPF